MQSARLSVKHSNQPFVEKLAHFHAFQSCLIFEVNIFEKLVGNHFKRIFWPCLSAQWSMVNGLLFHMTQPTSRSIIKAIACSKPIVSEHWGKWKHNGTIVDQCKQRGALCHIGLAKDRGGHLVNQPRLSLFYQVLRNNSWTSNKHNEKKNKKKQMNTEHGEENVQVKPHAYVHRWVDQI